jgi:hypothetical protein
MISWPGPLQTPHITDMDAQRKQRVAHWIVDRFDTGGDFLNTPQLLLDFWNFLEECEVERQRQ